MGLAISAIGQRAEQGVMTPAITHTSNSSSGEPSCPAMTPALRKSPIRMTPPTTSMMVEKRAVGNKARFGRGDRWGWRWGAQSIARKGARVRQAQGPNRHRCVREVGGVKSTGFEKHHCAEKSRRRRLFKPGVPP